jgi:ribosomal protein L14E/L6E/L27E
MIKRGQVVFSKRGRDKGLAFLVIEMLDEYVYLTDGRVRPLAKPKKKKIKHIQPTNTIIDLNEFNPRSLKDSDIRKLLAVYVRR